MWEGRSGPVRFVVVVVTGTVGTGNRACAGSGDSLRFDFPHVLLGFFFPSSSYSIIIDIITIIIGINNIPTTLVYCDCSSPQHKYSLSPDAFVLNMDPSLNRVVRYLSPSLYRVLLVLLCPPTPTDDTPTPTLNRGIDI